MRFICIGGLWIPAERLRPEKTIWTPLTREIGREIPNSTFVIKELEYLRLKQRARVLELIDHIVESCDDGEDTTLIGKSVGGKIAEVIANRFVRSRVRAIITIFTPHRLPMRFLVPKTHENHDIPILTFGGSWRDYVVPPILTRHRRSIAHKRLNSNHWRDIVANPEIAREIAVEIRRFLFPQT